MSLNWNYALLAKIISSQIIRLSHDSHHRRIMRCSPPPPQHSPKTALHTSPHNTIRYDIRQFAGFCCLLLWHILCLMLLSLLLFNRRAVSDHIPNGAYHITSSAIWCGCALSIKLARKSTQNFGFMQQKFVSQRRRIIQLVNFCHGIMAEPIVWRAWTCLDDLRGVLVIWVYWPQFF